MKKGLIVCLFTALMCMLFAGTSAMAEVALIENDTNAELNGDIIVAYYSRNGELLHTEIEKDVKLIKDDTYSLSLSRKDYSGAASARLMYVDDTENLIPLVKSDEVDLSANYAIISRAYLNSNTDDTDVVYGHLQKGDVIIYSVNLEGIIEDRADVEVLFSMGNEYTDYAREVSPNKWDDIVNDEYLNHIYENSYYVFGPIIDKTQHEITIGNVYELEDGSIVTATENVDDMRITDLDYSNDISIYICDFNEADGNRIFAGTKADIEKMNIRKSFMKKDSNGEFTLIDWNNENTPKGVYALARILDDEIMDIFVIIPPADVLIKN